jgi:hypothetical protein
MPKPEKIQFGIAEVVGSNPTRSISFVLVNYGIVLNSILITVEKKASNAMHDNRFLSP